MDGSFPTAPDGFKQRLESLVRAVRDGHGNESAEAVRDYADETLSALIAAGEDREVLESWYNALREGLSFSAYRRRWGG